MTSETFRWRKNRFEIGAQRTMMFYRTPCTHPFGRPSADERQGPSFSGKRRRLWSCSPFENKTTETTHERGGTSKGSVYVGRGSWSDGQWTLFSRLPSPHPFTTTDHLANPAAVRPRSDDFVGLFDGGRARPAASTGCPENSHLERTVLRKLIQVIMVLMTRDIQTTIIFKNENWTNVLKTENEQR